MLLSAIATVHGDGNFDLSWSSVDNGAAVSTGGGYTLFGIAGQADASGALTGGEYRLIGGFWGVASEDAATATPTPIPAVGGPAMVALGILLLTLVMSSSRRQRRLAARGRE